MKTIDITNPDFSLHCPFTGDVIFSEDSNEVLAQSVRGLWIEEVLDDPELKSSDLIKAWEQHGDTVLGSEDPEEAMTSFIENLDLPNHFAIHFHHEDSMIGGSSWIILAQPNAS